VRHGGTAGGGSAARVVLSVSRLPRQRRSHSARTHMARRRQCNAVSDNCPEAVHGNGY
jgi:hypothetical protein